MRVASTIAITPPIRTARGASASFRRAHRPPRRQRRRRRTNLLLIFDMRFERVGLAVRSWSDGLSAARLRGGFVIGAAMSLKDEQQNYNSDLNPRSSDRIRFAFLAGQEGRRTDHTRPLSDAHNAGRPRLCRLQTSGSQDTRLKPRMLPPILNYRRVAGAWKRLRRGYFILTTP